MKLVLLNTKFLGLRERRGCCAPPVRPSSKGLHIAATVRLRPTPTAQTTLLRTPSTHSTTHMLRPWPPLDPPAHGLAIHRMYYVCMPGRCILVREVMPPPIPPPPPPRRAAATRRAVRVRTPPEYLSSAKPLSGSSSSSRIAGGFKVLDDEGTTARDDLFYGRFYQAPTAPPDLSSADRRPIPTTADLKRWHRGDRRPLSASASNTSLALSRSSRSVEDLTAPGDWPGTEFVDRQQQRRRGPFKKEPKYFM